MNEQDFKKGISILYDMELNNYMMTRSIQWLDYKMKQLGKRQSISKPEREYDNRLAIETVDPSVKIGVLLGGILGVLFGFIWGASWSDIGFFSFFCAFIGAAILGFAFLLVGALLGLIVGMIKGKLEIEDHNDRLAEEYALADAMHDVAIQLDEERVVRELNEKDVLLAQKSILIARRKEAQEKLASFYDQMGIDERYRYLMPIAYMHEFIRLNISKKLEGVDGLYYLVSRELKADRMYLKLEEISAKFDAVIDNQHRLYGELSVLNARCEALIENTCMAAEIAAENNSLLQDAVKNTEIAAYNSERIAAENEYQSFLMTIDRF